MTLALQAARTGGFGAAKNLSNFAVKGTEAEVQPEVVRLLKEMTDAGKPVGAICIAPATLTRALSEKAPEVTIGSDADTARSIESMGGRHHACTVDMVHVDARNKLVTTPAYMLGLGIKDIAVGIDKLVQQIMTMLPVK